VIISYLAGVAVKLIDSSRWFVLISQTSYPTCVACLFTVLDENYVHVCSEITSIFRYVVQFHFTIVDIQFIGIAVLEFYLQSHSFKKYSDLHSTLSFLW